jgi:hypothetical protein
MTDYDSFIRAKMRRVEVAGFEPPLPICPMAFDWQKVLIEWAIRRGRAALFEECGLGKTLQELEWARQVCARTGGDVLILCSLGVVEQTVEEGRKFGIDVHCRQIPRLADYLRSKQGRSRANVRGALRKRPFDKACRGQPIPERASALHRSGVCAASGRARFLQVHGQRP